jgi:AhpD family alkylhydroperoxidase
VAANYVEVHEHIEERLAQLGRELPGPMSGFARLHKKAMEDGALSGRSKELMAVAISIVVHCEGCIAYHVHAAVAAGATRPELLETIGVAILMGGDRRQSTPRTRWMPWSSSRLWTREEGPDQGGPTLT